MSMSPDAQKSVFIKTFGCQMNVYDSNRMQNILGNQGFKVEADLRKADVILINTCSIRDKSEHKVLSLLGELAPLKEKNPKKIIGVTGCVGQRMGRVLLRKVPHLDLVMGPDSVDRVGNLVNQILESGSRIVEAELDHGLQRRYSQPTNVHQAKPVEFMTIMKGCDHFCTYCIVPFVRGREKSRSIAEILNDVRQLAARGTKEITFLGQNINTYGKGTGEKLSTLIEETNKIDGIERIRYVTSHPRDLGDDLIEQFGTVEKLCPVLHLPVQSGNNKILKRMARLYTREEYLQKIAKLRKARPDIAMSTDIIVGFPGETDEDFADTMTLLDEVKFSHAFLFKYSPRPGTRAFQFDDQEVPEKVKEARLLETQKLTMRFIEEENATYVGKTVPVLIESLDRKGMHYMGRSLHNKLVHVWNAGEACVGKIIDVEIQESNGSNLKGYYVDAPRITKDVSACLQPAAN